MTDPFIDRAKSKLQGITNIPDFEGRVAKELRQLASLTDDVAFVVIGHLYIQQKVVDVLAAFFASDGAKSKLDNFQSFGTLLTLLRLSNLCDDKLLQALNALNKIRNGFAHEFAALSALETPDAANNKQVQDSASFKNSIAAFKIKGANTKAKFDTWLRRIYVELRKVELIAFEIKRYISSADFIDELEPVAPPSELPEHERALFNDMLEAALFKYDFSRSQIARFLTAKAIMLRRINSPYLILREREIQSSNKTIAKYLYEGWVTATFDISVISGYEDEITSDFNVISIEDQGENKRLVVEQDILVHFAAIHLLGTPEPIDILIQGVRMVHKI